jgi:hypothetical protein
MKRIFIIITFLLLCARSFGTAQIPDILIRNGDTLDLFSCPLEYLKNPAFIHPSNLFGGKGCFYTSCWRNYVATWEIIDDKLYLTRIRNACYPTDQNYVAASFIGQTDSVGTEYASLKRLFPEKYREGRVFADWVTADLIAPQGELLYYVHDSFLSIFERETEFSVVAGVLTGVQEFDNSKTRVSRYTSDPDLIAEFISNNIDYSSLPTTDKIVRVIVSVRGADDSGRINDAVILRGFSDEYDHEALRVVKSIPEWDVLYRRGKRIPGPYWTIPVVFNHRN